MKPRFLVEIDLHKAENNEDGGLSVKKISYFSTFYIKVSPSTFEQAKRFLLDWFPQHPAYLDVTAFKDTVDEALELLDHGALKITVTRDQFKLLAEKYDLLPGHRERLVLAVDIANGEESLQSQPEDGFVSAQVDLLFSDVGAANRANAIAGEGWKDGEQIRYIRLPASSVGNFLKAVKSGYAPIISASSLTLPEVDHPDTIPADLLVTRSIRTDRPDGLYPTVVVNEKGICLGLVYSNEQSIRAAIISGRGVYWSRSSGGLWEKGKTSGDVQELIRIEWDCDADALRFMVRQKGDGFCHLKTATCFGQYSGITKLEQTLTKRKQSAPPKSYTKRLFDDPKLLNAKIMEEAQELCEAKTKQEIAAEAADLLYFALARCIAADVSLEQVEADLDLKSLKISRRKGDAKPHWGEKFGVDGGSIAQQPASSREMLKEATAVPKDKIDPAGMAEGQLRMKRIDVSKEGRSTVTEALKRPSQRSTDFIMSKVKPIIEKVQKHGDAAVLEFTRQFEKATSLKSPVLRAPFPEHLMQIDDATREAIDISFNNIHKFHSAQETKETLQVYTMPGVLCSRFSRPIERVGLYVPGGTAVLPSTALMLGVPALVAGCKGIVMASPPRSDGTLTPEVVYIAHKVGAESIVLAGGAQAVAAMAYGTESIGKVNKVLGPGNQFVTAAKMLVSNDTTANVSIDMPAGPSEVLVIADRTANPAFVASDLLSQAEHGPDSQVILIAIELPDQQLQAIEDELHAQAHALPRLDIVRGAIDHSVTLLVSSRSEAIALSNQYAPEHLILQIENAQAAVDEIQNAGSVFIGHWTPESVGDYSAGVNHSLPTYGYARQYSGVNLASFQKHITSSSLTVDGLKNVGPAVMQLAGVEKLEAHKRAVSIRLDHIARSGG